MPKHVLFADANVPTFDTINVALTRGYRVSLVRSNYRMYTETPFVKDTIARVHDITDIDDPTKLPEMFHAIQAIAKRTPIDAVITQLEPCVDVVADVCDALALPFTDARAVRNARNKAKAREIVAAAGLNSAKYAVVKTPDEAAMAAAGIGPVIVKPQTSYDSLLAYPARTPSEARKAAADLLAGLGSIAPQLREQASRGILVEEWLHGDLVSAEIGARDGKFYRFMLSGRPRSKENECIEMGASMPADVSEEVREECFSYAERVARALGLDLGIFHIEMIVTARGPVLVESNPRLMGGVMPGMYKHATNDDICGHLLDLHLGFPLSVPRQTNSAFITSRKLMPRISGEVARSFDLSWVENGPSWVSFSPYKLHPGASVNRLDILARYEVRGGSMTEADEIADDFLSKFEAEIGVPLIR
jgi:biotin carboxylase